jgi:hypothetical protein
MSAWNVANRRRALVFRDAMPASMPIAQMKATAILLTLIVIGVPFPLVAPPVHAASLTLGCLGTLTTTQVPKGRVASDPEKENVADFSVVVDFDKRAVSGFWSDLNGFREPIPITAADANGVTFKGSKEGPIQKSIWGTVDRITGKVDAAETWLWQTGALTQMAPSHAGFDSRPHGIQSRRSRPRRSQLSFRPWQNAGSTKFPVRAGSRLL